MTVLPEDGLLGGPNTEDHDDVHHPVLHALANMVVNASAEPGDALTKASATLGLPSVEARARHYIADEQVQTITHDTAGVVTITLAATTAAVVVNATADITGVTVLNPSVVGTGFVTFPILIYALTAVAVDVSASAEIIGPAPPASMLAATMWPVQYESWQLATPLQQVYLNDFSGPVGLASAVLGPEWELYDGAGNAGWGFRRADQIEVVAGDGSQTAGPNVLRLTAEMGTGADAGSVVSGGLKLLNNRMTYGRYTVRLRVAPDPDEVTSGVALLWPYNDREQFRPIDNPEGEWPAGGEIDFVEGWANRSTRLPVEFNLHYLNPAAVTPYTSADDAVAQTTYAGVNGSVWHTYVLDWLPGRVECSVDGAAPVVISTDPAQISDWMMELTLQLDAWDTPGNPGQQPVMTGSVTMDIDYVQLEAIVGSTIKDGSGAFTVAANGDILDRWDRQFASAGMNAATGIEGAYTWATNEVAAWSHDGFPEFDIEPDIWPGIGNVAGGSPIFPGGVITAHRAWSNEANAFVDLTDRAYATNGYLSAEAVAAGISMPLDHWRTRLVRVPCVLRTGPESVVGADVVLDRADTIPQYVANCQQLSDLGLVSAPTARGLTATNPIMPPALIAAPWLDTTSLPDDDLRDALEFCDAVIDNCAPSTTWLALPNVPYTTGRDINYDDFVFVFVVRARARGWGGIISIPTANDGGDLGPIANAEYTGLRTRLDSWGMNWGLVWEWHNYGAHKQFGQADQVYTYPEVDAQLAACRAGINGHRYAIWMAEYGQASPEGTGGRGGNDQWNREAVLIMATDTYGPALAVKYPQTCGTWWHATGDNTWDRSYALTYGELNLGNPTGPDPNPQGTNPNPGTMPFWDIDGTPATTQWLTPGGLAHWDLAHAVWTEPIKGAL